MMLKVPAATMIALLGVSLAPGANAVEKATRCGEMGCDRIYCDETGNRCYRHSDYDRAYGGGWDDDSGPAAFHHAGPPMMAPPDDGYAAAPMPPPPPAYGEYQGYDRAAYGESSCCAREGATLQGAYRRHAREDYAGNEYHGPYRGEYVHHFDGRGGRVCDSDGDRCYMTRSAVWDYHEYYERQGYHWQTRYAAPRSEISAPDGDDAGPGDGDDGPCN